MWRMQSQKVSFARVSIVIATQAWNQAAVATAMPVLPNGMYGVKTNKPATTIIRKGGMPLGIPPFFGTNRAWTSSRFDRFRCLLIHVKAIAYTCKSNCLYMYKRSLHRGADENGHFSPTPPCCSSGTPPLAGRCVPPRSPLGRTT